MENVLYIKFAVLLYTIMVFPVLWAYDGRNVTDSVYSEYMREYPQVIIEKQTDKHLENLYSDLDGEDELLTGFLKKKTGHSYIVDVYQDNYQNGNDPFQITLTTVRVSQSVVMYVYANNYSSSLGLYNQPDADKPQSVFTEYMDTKMYVTDFMGLWLQVTFVYEGHTYMGWISPNSYCSNPYSTCN